MKKILYPLGCLWLLLPVIAGAQSHNAKAAAPRPVYQSAFADLPAFDPERPTADKKDWRKANEDVAQFPRGHVDILKWEEAQTKKRSAATPQPATDHSKMHGGEKAK